MEPPVGGFQDRIVQPAGTVLFDDEIMPSADPNG
jgi:hypothetical protein